MRVGQSIDHANLPSHISNSGIYEGRKLVCGDDEGVVLGVSRGVLIGVFRLARDRG